MSDSRHGLVDGFDAVAHGELIHDVLGNVVKVDFPRVVPTGLWDLHRPVSVDVGGIVEEVLEKKNVSTPDRILQTFNILLSSDHIQDIYLSRSFF